MEGDKMPKFTLKENETILANFLEVEVYANDNKFVLDVVLTNERAVLLKDISNELDYVNVLRGRGHFLPTDFEIVLEIKQSDVENFTYKNNCNIISLKNKNTLNIYCDDFRNYSIK